MTRELFGDVTELFDVGDVGDNGDELNKCCPQSANILPGLSAAIALDLLPLLDVDVAVGFVFDRLIQPYIGAKRLEFWLDDDGPGSFTLSERC